jgi:hypothetical protein
MNIYIELTKAFNEGRLRAILSSGQAVVLHRLALMSKDGDWILREDEETMNQVLGVLGRCDARYRFGAPLDTRWLTHGWSAHFEFRHNSMRVRADFVTRPPRLGADQLDSLWRENERATLPFADARTLIELKKTNREKDYVVIGELARKLTDPRDQLMCARSAQDLIALAQQHPDLVAQLAPARPVLLQVHKGRDALEAALDAERRALIHANEQRLARYAAAAQQWREAWNQLEHEIAQLPLAEAHRHIVRRAEQLLPQRP